MLGVVSDPIRVRWLIKGLGPGGAEHLLLAAAATRDRTAFEVSAGYLLPWKDALVTRLEAFDVPVRCLNVIKESDLRWAVRLRRWFIDEPVDVVHVHSPYVAAITRLVVRSLPSKIRPRMVSTEHNAWSTFKTPTRQLNAWTAGRDDAVIAVSDETRDSMRPTVRERCEVLIHGIDTHSVASLRNERSAVRREFGISTESFVVGTIANYHPKKDWPNVLRAVRAVIDQRRDVRAILVGQGPLQDEVERLFEELDLGSSAVLTGFRPDAVRLLSACDVFVLGSKWEGLPVALMEAMALGLPIVATAVGGIPNAIEHDVDGLLVDSGDPAALAAAIERVAADPNLANRLARRSNERAPEFDAARAQRRVEAIYRAVLAR
jgi:L-malate glycosyltransferase